MNPDQESFISKSFLFVDNESGVVRLETLREQVRALLTKIYIIIYKMNPSQHQLLVFRSSLVLAL